ncbi:MAG: M2 family metallopeptidase, partial [Bacteroidales bacterium]
MKRVLGGIMTLGILCSACTNKTERMESELKSFIQECEKTVAPIEKEAALAYWNSSITGADADFQIYEAKSKELTAYFADKVRFETLKKIKESKAVKDELLKRQMDVLYLSFLANQVDLEKLNKTIEIQTKIEQKYSKFRAIVGKDTLSDNDIESELKKSTDNLRLEAIWKAHKEIGNVVAADIIALAKLRNEIAEELGYKNYHEMSLELSEQDPKEILAIFDELDGLTKDAFTQLKSEMDDHFVKRYKLSKEALMPWHYQNRFFQEAPTLYPVDLDAYYKDKNIEKLTSDFFAGINLNADNILANSDLYEKENKNQHAYCITIDKKGDVRVLGNLKNTEMWMGTMLHEFGHAVYDKNIDPTVPYVLKEPAHTFTTEAVAMLFGRNSTNPVWMSEMGIISADDAKKIGDNGFKQLRLQQLVFSRWAQVMYRFEKGLYENPDQDLNALWWSLVEKYQLIKKPQGRENMADWASKIHIATSPCYYHNYLLGELLASQLNNYICTQILKTDNIKTPNYVGNIAIGEYMVNKVFAPGAIYPWNEMIEKATGEKLTAKYYA